MHSGLKLTKKCLQKRDKYLEIFPDPVENDSSAAPCQQIYILKHNRAMCGHFRLLRTIRGYFGQFWANITGHSRPFPNALLPNKGPGSQRARCPVGTAHWPICPRECHLFSWYLELSFSKWISMWNFIINVPQMLFFFQNWFCDYSHIKIVGGSSYWWSQWLIPPTIFSWLKSLKHFWIILKSVAHINKIPHRNPLAKRWFEISWKFSNVP